MHINLKYVILKVFIFCQNLRMISFRDLMVTFCLKYTYACFIDDYTGSLKPADRESIMENAEVLFADGEVITDVVYSTKKMKWAACTWAGQFGFLLLRWLSG